MHVLNTKYRPAYFVETVISWLKKREKSAGHNRQYDGCWTIE